MNDLAKTKEWLNIRFRQTDSEGVFFAHQPIYGFRDLNSERYVVNRIIVTYNILKTLSKIKFNSFADIGGAEGYKAALVKKLFNVDVISCDLSEEACKRANEIYGLKTKPIDIQNMDFDDEEFDVVLCSETLEHVTDLEKATNELLRIAKKAVVITVPNESIETVAENKESGGHHQHIHSFDEDTFDKMGINVSKIECKKILHPILNIPSAFVEAKKKKFEEVSYPGLAVNLYNFAVPVLKRIFGATALKSIVGIDQFLRNTNLANNGYLFLLIKDENIYKDPVDIKIAEILNFTVPYHYLNSEM